MKKNNLNIAIKKMGKEGVELISPMVKQALQLFPLEMVACNIIDPGCSKAVKKISGDILDRESQPLLVLNSEGDTVLANAALRKMARVLSGDGEIKICFKELDFRDEQLAKILDFGIPIRDYRDNLVLNENTNIPVRVSAYPIFIGQDLRLGTVCIIDDLTIEAGYQELLKKLKEFEHQLDRSGKLSSIGELAAGTAHEIRNPLTTVRGFVQIIQQKIRKNETSGIDSYVQLILAEIDRINKILTDFLNLAKPQEAKMEPVNINELLNEVMFLMENEALRKEIHINQILAEQVPLVTADKYQLAQVFLNIISNAFQAMPVKNGVLTIRSSVLDDQSKVNVDFIDNGEGIPEELLNKIFDPFVSTKENGTGLGLAISRRIINAHGGEIKVTSRPGEGAMFSVFLPVGEK
ncbi:hypothetical protein IT084_01905 [Desulfallas sp. Bu1-1]|uniref:two-component system sensor histidine kinase NtrB n=1 Tax=Desulfallas sp. Bu1-1 TaxID=2787620 RepID=UPI00189EB5CF|nr:ATP-binding protein [Desulfallas sp. Bu1-1]MBF7081736.1 hypothetical protein [Desulfallas sp. Bu1-1]